MSAEIHFPYLSVEAMYGEQDLGMNPIFPGDYINYGDWQGLPQEFPIQIETRIAAAANIYFRLAGKIDVSGKDTVLEVGSGRGRGSRLVIDTFNPGYFVAVDASPYQVARTQRHLYGATAAYARQADAEQLPFPDGLFDKVLSVEAIQHFQDPAKFIAEAGRITAPAGKIAIASFFANNRLALPQLAEMFPTVGLGIDKMNPIEDIATHLSAAGFSNIEAEPRGKYVWRQLVDWCHQVQPDQTWSDNWLTAYRQGWIDYYHIFAGK